MTSLFGRRKVAASLAGALLVGSIPAIAVAQSVPKAEVMIIHAAKVDGAGSMDPKLAGIPQLKQPPFDKYNSFAFIRQQSVDMPRNAKSAPVALPNGTQLAFTLLEVKDDRRMRIAGDITGGTKAQHMEVTAKPNEAFFVAGAPHAGGILVLGITARE